LKNNLNLQDYFFAIHLGYEVFYESILQNRFVLTINKDKLVKSSLLRHSRAGGNPEHTEMTGSKSTLSPACAGMTEQPKYLGFHKTINNEKLVKTINSRWLSKMVIY